LFIDQYLAVKLIFPSSFLKTRTFSSLYKNQPGRPGQDVKTGHVVGKH